MKPQTFAVMSGVLVGATGVLGMFPRLQKRAGKRRRKENKLQSGYGEIFGMIPTNTAFNWLRVGIGVTGLIASRGETSAKIFNRSLAGAYGGMAIMGMIPATKTVFGLLPLFGGNVILHSGTAVAELLTERNLAKKAGKLLPFSREESRPAAVSMDTTAADMSSPEPAVDAA